MDEAVRGPLIPSRAFETRARGKSSAPTRKRPTKIPAAPTQQPDRRRRLIGRHGGRGGRRHLLRLGGSHYGRLCDIGRRGCNRGRGRNRRRGSSRGRRSGLDHLDDEAGDAGERGRDTGGVVGRCDESERSEALHVGQGSGEADGLDVQVRYRESSIVECRCASLVSPVGENHEHLVGGIRAEALAGANDSVVQGRVTARGDQRDLKVEQAPVGGGRCEDAHAVGERFHADADIRRHRSNEFVRGGLGVLDRRLHALRGVDREDHLDIVGRHLGSGCARQRR